jgi:hypothetical protein
MKRKERVPAAGDNDVEAHADKPPYIKPIKRTTTLNDILKYDPLANENVSLDNIYENTFEYFEETAKTALSIAVKEEKKQIKQLVSASYYPEKQDDHLTETELIIKCINLI